MYIEIATIQYQDPALIAARLPQDKVMVFLDSAIIDMRNRYSYICYDPFAVIRYHNRILMVNNEVTAQCPLKVLASYLQTFRLPPHEVPFTGGLAGYIGYEFLSYLEPRLRLTKTHATSIPDFIIAAFDIIIAFDHYLKKAWIFSSGLPEKSVRARKIKAKNRSDSLLSLIEENKPQHLKHEYLNHAQLNSTTSREGFCGKVIRALDYIKSGDVYQVNLAQCFQSKNVKQLPWSIYERLRITNPAPFAAYLQFADLKIASASPERFIKVQDSIVETSPIKGTAARSHDTLSDKQLAEKLQRCEKNRAENLMIVDLMRNDLSKVCELNSVSVEKLFEVQSFKNVHHLVSSIKGKLRPTANLIDLLVATFPGGSITGAPKVRAMEIINELEDVPRGPYCGAIGFFGFNGNMDTSITIRTIILAQDILSFHVGAGIVADSNPHDEYLETLVKANALYETLTGLKLYF